MLLVACHMIKEWIAPSEFIEWDKVLSKRWPGVGIYL